MNKKQSMKKEWLIIVCITVLSTVSVEFGNNSLLAQATNVFVVDTTKAVTKSSGWENEAFTATIFLSGSGSYAPGNWKLIVNPPFPHPISGIDDSFVQAAIGIALMRMEPEIGMSWLLKAALQDEIDAIMFLSISYATVPEVKNPAESERWFRKAMELGNLDAEAKLNDLLAGRPVQSSLKVSNAYNFKFSKVD